LIQEAKKKGLPVSLDVPIYYLFLNESSKENIYFVYPSISSSENQKELLNCLHKGYIDVISSMHSSVRSTQVGQEGLKPAAGVSSSESLLPLLLALSHQGELSLLDVFSHVTKNPSEILFGEKKIRGIRAGGVADLFVVDPKAPWKKEQEAVMPGSENAYQYRQELQGKVLMTMVEGDIVYKAGKTQ